jgi:hypothetical protein
MSRYCDSCGNEMDRDGKVCSVCETVLKYENQIIPDRIRNLQEEMKDLKEEKEKLGQQIYALRVENEKLKTDAEQGVRQQQRERNEAMERTTELEDLRQELGRAESERDELAEQLGAKKARGDKLEQELQQEKNTSLARLRTIADLEKQRMDGVDKLQELQDLLDAERAAKVEAVEKVKCLEIAIGQLQQDLLAKTHFSSSEQVRHGGIAPSPQYPTSIMYRAMQEKLDTLDKANHELADRVLELTRELTTLLEKNTALQAQVDKDCGDYEREHKEQIIKLRAQIRPLEEKSHEEALVMTARSVMDERKGWEAVLKQKENRISVLEQECAAKDRKLQDMKNNWEALSDTRNRLCKQRDEAQKEVQKLSKPTFTCPKCGKSSTCASYSVGGDKMCCNCMFTTLLNREQEALKRADVEHARFGKVEELESWAARLRANLDSANELSHYWAVKCQEQAKKLKEMEDAPCKPHDFMGKPSLCGRCGAQDPTELLRSDLVHAEDEVQRLQEIVDSKKKSIVALQEENGRDVDENKELRRKAMLNQDAYLKLEKAMQDLTDRDLDYRRCMEQENTDLKAAHAAAVKLAQDWEKKCSYARADYEITKKDHVDFMSKVSSARDKFVADQKVEEEKLRAENLHLTQLLSRFEHSGGRFVPSNELTLDEQIRALRQDFTAMCQRVEKYKEEQDQRIKETTDSLSSHIDVVGRELYTHKCNEPSLELHSRQLEKLATTINEHSRLLTQDHWDIVKLGERVAKLEQDQDHGADDDEQVCPKCSGYGIIPAKIEANGSPSQCGQCGGKGTIHSAVKEKATDAATATGMYDHDDHV